MSNDRKPFCPLWQKLFGCVLLTSVFSISAPAFLNAQEKDNETSLADPEPAEQEKVSPDSPENDGAANADDSESAAAPDSQQQATDDSGEQEPESDEPGSTSADDLADEESAGAQETATIAEPDNGSGRVRDISFDDLTFEMEKDEAFDRSMLTESIFELHGTTLKIRGYIRPTTRQNNITKFIFVRDNKECCFGPGAALYDCILVKMADDESVEYTVRPVTLRGTFFLSEYEGPDGRTWAIYRMKDVFLE